MTLRENEFEYGGLNSRTDLHIIMGMVIPPIAPSMAEESVDIPGRYGVHFMGTNYTSRTFNIPFTIMAKRGSADYVQITQVLASLLLSDRQSDQGVEYPLRFGFNPDVTYWGHLTGIADPQAISEGNWDTTSSLTFVQSDPTGTLPQVEQKLTGGMNTINVKGSALADPVIQIIPKRALKFVGYTMNDGFFGLGPEDEAEQDQAVQEYEEVVDDPIGSMALWTNDADAVSSMKVSGTYVYQGTAAISPTTSAMTVKTVNGKKDFGTIKEGYWQGPANRYTGLTTSLTNFKIHTGIHYIRHKGDHNGRAMGQVQLLLLDPNGQVFGRFRILGHKEGQRSDIDVQICTPNSGFKTKNSDFVNLVHEKPPVIKNLKNVPVKIKYTVTVTKTTTKKNKKGKTTKKTTKKKETKYIHVVNREVTNALDNGWFFLDLERRNGHYYWDVKEYDLKTGKAKKGGLRYKGNKKLADKYQSVLGGFGCVLFKHDITEDKYKVAYKNTYLSLTQLSVWRINTNVTSSEPTYVSNAGQEIMIDSEAGETTVDSKLVAPVWVTDYPKLRPGINQLNIVGDVADADITLKYLPRVL